MQLSAEDRKLIETFNRNVEWLKKNPVSVPVKNNLPEWISAEDAMNILGRRRTWLKTRMMEFQLTLPCNTNWFLIRGIDYERKNGKILVFRSQSVQRLKSEMRRMGAAESVPDEN